MIKKVYAPWRASYYEAKEIEPSEKISCPFCEQARSPEAEDETHFILKRLKHCYIMLNIYPYNPGHLMVVPYTHGDSLNELSREIRTEIMDAITISLDLLKQAFDTPGFNVGLNIGGRVAGGSIPDHLHFHVLPRYEGDTSFLTALAGTKAVSADLRQIYQKLRQLVEATPI